MNKQHLLLAALAAATLTACQNTVSTVENRDKSMQTNYIDSKYVSTDRFLKGRLIIDSINKSTLPSGLMMVQFTVRSDRTGFWSETWSSITGADPYKVEYKIDWLDKDGMEVPTATSTWLQLDLIPGETRRLQTVAPNPRCQDFMLNFKEYGK